MPMQRIYPSTVVPLAVSRASDHYGQRLLSVGLLGGGRRVFAFESRGWAWEGGHPGCR